METTVTEKRTFGSIPTKRRFYLLSVIVDMGGEIASYTNENLIVKMPKGEGYRAIKFFLNGRGFDSLPDKGCRFPIGTDVYNEDQYWDGYFNYCAYNIPEMMFNPEK